MHEGGGQAKRMVINYRKGGRLMLRSFVWGDSFGKHGALLAYVNAGQGKVSFHAGTKSFGSSACSAGSQYTLFNRASLFHTSTFTHRSLLLKAVYPRSASLPYICSNL